jgi:hypothetical protein
MISAMELLEQPIKWMDAETAAAPSAPEEEHNHAEHDQHEGCEAQTPLEQ